MGRGRRRGPWKAVRRWKSGPAQRMAGVVD